jgi:hypothetical protein
VHAFDDAKIEPILARDGDTTVGTLLFFTGWKAFIINCPIASDIATMLVPTSMLFEGESRKGAITWLTARDVVVIATCSISTSTPETGRTTKGVCFHGKTKC